MSQRSIIIVGAGQGVGYETAERFAREGFSIGLIRRSTDQLDTFASKLRASGIAVATKAASADDPKGIASAVTALGEELGGIDVLVYNVPGPLREAYVRAIDISLPSLHTFLTVRVVSALATVQAALSFLEQSNGAVFFTSGQSDRKAFPGTGLIGAPQAALRMLAEHLHTELRESGVFVGYLPLDNPPLYSDPEQEAQRTDIPAGFSLPERVVASDVADKIFALNNSRDTFECAVKSSTHVST